MAALSYAPEDISAFASEYNFSGDQPTLSSCGAEPQPAGEASGTQLFTVRRGANVDEIEIVRPHVTKAESSVWRTRAKVTAIASKGPSTGSTQPASW